LISLKYFVSFAGMQTQMPSLSGNDINARSIDVGINIFRRYGCRAISTGKTINIKICLKFIQIVSVTFFSKFKLKPSINSHVLKRVLSSVSINRKSGKSSGQLSCRCTYFVCLIVFYVTPT
jgi:hypothetical protein